MDGCFKVGQKQSGRQQFSPCLHSAPNVGESSVETNSNADQNNILVLVLSGDIQVRVTLSYTTAASTGCWFKSRHYVPTMPRTSTANHRFASLRRNEQHSLTKQFSTVRSRPHRPVINHHVNDIKQRQIRIAQTVDILRKICQI